MPGFASLSASFGSEYGGSFGSGLSVMAGKAGSPVLAGFAALLLLFFPGEGRSAVGVAATAIVIGGARAAAGVNLRGGSKTSFRRLLQMPFEPTHATSE